MAEANSDNRNRHPTRPIAQRIGGKNTSTCKFQDTTRAQVEKLPRFYGVHERLGLRDRIWLFTVPQGVHPCYRLGICSPNRFAV
jgi:hypothetical protein